MSKGRKVHYSGGLAYATKRSHFVMVATWAACCSGDAAWRIRELGNHTEFIQAVTCARCLALYAIAVRR